MNKFVTIAAVAALATLTACSDNAADAPADVATEAATEAATDAAAGDAAAADGAVSPKEVSEDNPAAEAAE